MRYVIAVLLVAAYVGSLAHVALAASGDFVNTGTVNNGAGYEIDTGYVEQSAGSSEMGGGDAGHEAGGGNGDK